MITAREWYGLIPFVLLSVVYWFRSILNFNRAPTERCQFTPTQWRVLIILYPCWVFFEWMRGLATRRNMVGVLLATATASTSVSFYTSVGILNDEFRFTRQQFAGFFVNLFISYMWCVSGMLMYGADEDACDAA